MKNKTICLGLLVFFLLFHLVVIAQGTIGGKVIDADSGDPLIGANIIIQESSIGTVTDLDGNFTLRTDQSLPLTIDASLIGYGTASVTIDSYTDNLIINLTEEASILNEVVVSASRTEERLLESPVTIEKLDLIAIKNASAGDYYDELTNIKGVSSNSASLTFNTINTRGFYSAANTRFVQLQDGIDNAAPILNFPTGNVVGISELDIANVELVPGASSALYGPNAFNGTLIMNSKNPFKYDGLSLQTKQGFTDQREQDHYQSYSLRWAQNFDDKLAYKVNFSYLSATDWRADNYDTNADPVNLPGVTAGDPNFDGIHLYGDETQLPTADLFGFDLTRTGFREDDLLENRDAESLKIGGALHYKVADDVEAIASYQYGKGASVYQGSQRYALRDFVQQFAKVELKSSDWFIRAYGTFTDAGNTYNTGALGILANEVLFPSLTTDNSLGAPLNGGWIGAYGFALSGRLAALGIPAGDPNAARNFADRGGFSIFDPATLGAINAQVTQGILQDNPGLPQAAAQALATRLLEIQSGAPRVDENGNLTPEALQAINMVRSGVFQRPTPGAGLIDDSRAYQFEGNYNFSRLLDDKVNLLIGGNYRIFDLFTDGTVLREPLDANGNFERISNTEYGIYAQASKTFAEQFKLTGSVRYDKNENFDGQFSPRLSAVYSFGEEKEHNLRASFQTGFRNPTMQGQFIFFPQRQVLLGGTAQNASFTYTDDNGNQVDWNLFEPSQGGAVTVEGGEPIDLDYVQPEKVQAFEVGYKGLINRKLYIDVNYYYNSYKDFISQVFVRSGRELQYRGVTYPAGQLFFPYTNVPVEFSSNGIDLGTRYGINRNWTVAANYSWADFSFDEQDLVGTTFEGSGFRPGFNTPNHKFFLSLDNKNSIKNVGAGINYRWQDEIDWVGSFAQGTVESFGVMGAYVSYKIPASNVSFKLGATNLLKTEYLTNPGSPVIGRTVILTVTYDQFGN